MWNQRGLYVFAGGWLATIAGWGLCTWAAVKQRRLIVPTGVVALGLLPALYIAGLKNLSALGPSPSSSGLGFGIILVGLALAIAAGPAAAILMARRR